MDGIRKEVKMRMGKMVVRFSLEGRECRLHGLLCAADLTLCDIMEER